MYSDEVDILDESNPAKRGRTNESINEPFRNISNWETLPYPVTVEVFSHLCDKDRVAMAQVCRNWYISFKSPSLWRRRQFVLNQTSDKKCIDFTSLFGSCLQDVTIMFIHKHRNNRTNIAETMESLTENLKSAKLFHLNTAFILLDQFKTYSVLMEKLTKSLIKLLQTQTELKNVGLTSSHYSQPMGTEVLNILATSAGCKLEHLDVTNFLHKILNVNDLDQLKETLTKFTNLTSIFINYSYISDEVLRHWADSLRHKLKSIKINASKTEPHHHIIRSETWRQLSASCPKLIVSIKTCGIFQANEIIRLLQANIPLHTFVMMTLLDDSLEDPSNVQMAIILKHLSDCFHHRLVHISLFWRIKQHFVDEELVDVLERCRKLEKFTFFGDIGIMVPKKIFLLLKDSQSILRTVEIVSNFDTTADPEIRRNLNMIEALLPDTFEDDDMLS